MADFKIPQHYFGYIHTVSS